MSINLRLGAAALLIAASSTCAMAQATGKENNATTGSESGAGPASGAEQKGGGSMKGEMKSSPDASGSSGSSSGASGAQPSGAYGTADKPTVGDKNDGSSGSGK